MSESENPVRSLRQVARREAILRAAIDVFGREGYAGASVEEIARIAEVAKPTVYARFGDKASLFAEAVTEAAGRSNDAVLRVIDATRTEPEVLRSELERLGVALVGCLMDKDGAAVVRLQMTEHAAFGSTFDAIRKRNRSRTLDRLAGKLAQLANAGRLQLRDPNRAARHLLAMIHDDALARSDYGITILEAHDTVGFVADAVDTFLAAFGATASARPREPQSGG